MPGAATGRTGRLYYLHLSRRDADGASVTGCRINIGARNRFWPAAVDLGNEIDNIIHVNVTIASGSPLARGLGQGPAFEIAHQKRYITDINRAAVVGVARFLMAATVAKRWIDASTDYGAGPPL